MEEALRRLAASSSIDVTNLVKTPEQLQQEQQAAMEAEQQMQQQEMMSNMMTSPAAGKIADNFTQPGMPYGPQIEPGGEAEQGNAALPTSTTSQPPLSKAEVTTDSPDLPREITITPEMVEEFQNKN